MNHPQSPRNTSGAFVNNWRHNKAWLALMGLWGCISSSVLCTISLLLAPFFGAKRAFFACSRLWVRQQFALTGIECSVEGWEALPESIKNGSQPVIFMSNHESLLDPPFLLHAVPIHSVFMAKKEVRYLPGIGWATWMAGFIFVDRSRSDKAAASVKKAASTIKAGLNLTMFPEGTRSRDGRLGEFKKGGFFLAVKAGVPIVPVAVKGTHQVLPPGCLIPQPGKVQARFGQPVYQEHYKSRESLVTEVRNRVEGLLEGMA